MKDHDSDNDFLDDLYLHSAKEAPPAALDQAILKQAHNKVHQGKFFPRYQWQQIFSVAAVLVLSVFIVLDSADQGLAIDDFSLTEEQAPRMEEQYLKTEKSKVTTMMDSAARESTAESDELSMSGLKKQHTSEINASQSEKNALEVETKQVSRNLSAPSSIKEITSDETLSAHASADESLIATPEKMIAEIEKLIAEGKLIEANQRYKEFSAEYPSYLIAIEIVEALK
jgi:hypothetical protein